MKGGYKWIQELKRERKRPVTALLAMHKRHDPFYCGSETDQKRGRWFASIWRRLGYEGQTGIHLRRVHYRLVDAGFKNWDRMRYQNSKHDWDDLLRSSARARYLELVSADAFVDRRNDDPVSAFWVAGEHTPMLRQAADPWPKWWLPEIWLYRPAWTMPTEPPQVIGYFPDDFLDRSFYLEIWIEKSTQNDILIPLCRDLGITLAASSGFQSVSNVIALLERVRRKAKPARIFYISDFDDAGRQMPVQVARQIEFWIDRYAPEADIKLQPLALTAEQIRSFRLPPDPEHNRVELDALEARHPGQLATLVREAVAPYMDATIERRLRQAEQQAAKLVSSEWSEMLDRYRREIATAEQRARAAERSYEAQIKKMNQRLRRDTAQIAATTKKLREQMERDIRAFAPALPARPDPAARGQDETEWLFDSARTYDEQLEFYKLKKGR